MGHPLNVHAQLAHSPALLAACSSLRAVIAEHGTLDPKVSWALNLATAATVGNDYMIGIARRFARMNSWTKAQIATLRTGAAVGGTKGAAFIGIQPHGLFQAHVYLKNIFDISESSKSTLSKLLAQLFVAFHELAQCTFE